MVLILLAAGEFYLYRQQQQLKKMISEGLMQIKEQVEMSKAVPTTSPVPTLKSPKTR